MKFMTLKMIRLTHLIILSLLIISCSISSQPEEEPIVNQSPSIPEYLNSENYIEINQDEEFVCSLKVNDPDNDNVLVVISWGDGDTTISGYKQSGSLISASHKYTYKDDYYLNYMAKDDRGGISSWQIIKKNISVYNGLLK